MKRQAIAAATERDLWYFPPVDTHLIRSKHVTQTFQIQVARPPRKRSDTARLPVVYVTDGNEFFTLFKEYSRLMQLFGVHPCPSFILVGIGYPSDAPFSGMVLRHRDYCPADYFIPNSEHQSLLDELVKSSWHLEGLLLPEEGIKSTNFHGADNYRDFIGKELIPFIDENCETIPGDRTYFGHSGGGDFGLFTLCTETHLFRNYIISSPGLSHKWKEEVHDHGFLRVRELIASGKSLEGIKLYMSVGTEETFQPLYYQSGSQLTASFFRMAGLLKDAAIPGLDLMVEVIPGESHLSVWPIAFMHGVQAVFGMRRIGEILFPPNTLVPSEKQ
jgi:predicted alpha/beta superfamily hydrolase